MHRLNAERRKREKRDGRDRGRLTENGGGSGRGEEDGGKVKRGRDREVVLRVITERGCSI